MKKFFSLIWVAFCLTTCIFAQQQRELRRSTSPLFFPEFKEAKVMQPFGRFIKVKGNILLKNGAFCYMENDKVMQAQASNILGVKFDSVEFKKIDETQMGRVVSAKGYNSLLCVTTVDMDKFNAENGGGENLNFFEIADIGPFIQIDSEGQQREYDKGFPLKDKYYFYIKGTIIPANETQFKKHVRPEMKRAFKNLMADRWWSWKDEESLKQLLQYLPD